MSNSVAVQKRLPSVQGSAHRGKAARPRKRTSLAPERMQFFSAFLREPLTVGAFWPSSRALAEKIVEGCDLPTRETVVELGPGTGAFTGLILEGLRKRSQFFALEINPLHVRELQRRFPRLHVYGDSAERLPSYLPLHGRGRADCVISGLAWGSMLPGTQNRILDAVLTSLAPDGMFTTFAYAHARWLPTSIRFRRRLFRHFARVETTPIVWRNLPPAFIYRCWR